MSSPIPISAGDRLLSLTPIWCRTRWELLKTSPLYYRLAKGAWWSLVGALLSRGLTLVSSILVARMLGKAGFGQLGIIQSTVGLFGDFAGFGLGLTATKYLAELKQKDLPKAGRILALSTVVSWTTGFLATLTLVFLAHRMAVRTLGAPELVEQLQVAALLVLLGAVNGAQSGALSGFEAFKPLAKVNFLGSVAYVPCLTIGCWLQGLTGAVWGIVTAQAITCIVSRRALIQEARRWKIPNWSSRWTDEVSILWKFSLPAVFASLLVSPAMWYCQALVVRHSSGYQGMADYAVGTQWRNFVQYLPGLLCSAYLPVAASMRGTDVHRRRNLMLSGALFSAGLTAIMGAGVFFGSDWILAMYGRSFVGAKPVVGLMLLTGVVEAANTILLQTLMASGMAWLRLISNSIWGILLVVVSIQLVPRYGALGLAWAFLLAQSVHIVLQIRLSLYALKRTS